MLRGLWQEYYRRTGERLEVDLPTKGSESSMLGLLALHGWNLQMDNFGPVFCCFSARA